VVSVEPAKVVPKPVEVEPPKTEVVGEEKEAVAPEKFKPLEKPKIRFEELRAKYEELFRDIFGKLEVEFLQRKAQQMEDLHNDLVEMIAWHINNGVNVDTVCFVLDIIKHELTTEKLKQIYSGVSIRKAMETPIELKR